MTYITPLVIISRPPRRLARPRERLPAVRIPHPAPVPGLVRHAQRRHVVPPETHLEPVFRGVSREPRERAGFLERHHQVVPHLGAGDVQRVPGVVLGKPGGRRDERALLQTLPPGRRRRRKTTRAVCRRRGSRSLASGGRRRVTRAFAWRANARAAGARNSTSPWLSTRRSALRGASRARKWPSRAPVARPRKQVQTSPLAKTRATFLGSAAHDRAGSPAWGFLVSAVSDATAPCARRSRASRAAAPGRSTANAASATSAPATSASASPSRRRRAPNGPFSPGPFISTRVAPRDGEGERAVLATREPPP